MIKTFCFTFSDGKEAEGNGREGGSEYDARLPRLLTERADAALCIHGLHYVPLHVHCRFSKRSEKSQKRMGTSIPLVHW